MSEAARPELQPSEFMRSVLETAINTRRGAEEYPDSTARENVRKNAAHFFTLLEKIPCSMLAETTNPKQLVSRLNEVPGCSPGFFGIGDQFTFAGRTLRIVGLHPHDSPPLEQFKLYFVVDGTNYWDETPEFGSRFIPAYYVFEEIQSP